MKAISQSLTMITLLALAALISEADIPTAAKIAQRILSAISKPFELYKQELFVTA